MSTLTGKSPQQVRANGVRFEGQVLHVTLNDGREIAAPLDKVPWLNWLRNATPAQRNQWSIEPGGYAIYWEALDDGIEVCHLLDTHPVA